jgi:hypothetical protein
MDTMTTNEELQTAPLPAGTPLTMRQRRYLMSGLNPDRVEKKQRMSYMQAWDIKRTLIAVFGHGGFSAECIDSKIIKGEQVAQVNDATKMNWSITAQATVRLTIHQTGAVYTETAIAGSKQPDFTESADMAIKSAESDALKRAAIYLGTQFGLSLYDNGSTDEVVKNVFAPGVEWPPSPRQLREELEQFHRDTLQPPPPPVEQQAPQTTPQQAAQVMGNIVHQQRPGVQMQEPVPSHHGTSLTPELAQHTQELISRGLQMKRANGDPGLDNGPAGVLDRSLDSDAYNDGMDAMEAEAMAAADGHHE